MRRLSGIAASHTVHPYDVISVDAQLDFEPQQPWSRWGPDGMVLLLPFGDGRWRVILYPYRRPEAGDARADAPDAAWVQALLYRIAGRELALHEVEWLSRYRCEHRHAARYRRHRVVLVGDAALVHPPTGGQGLNTGLADAMSLGWRLAAAVTEPRHEVLLDAYAEERRRSATHVMRLTAAMLHFNALPSPWGHALRAVVLTALRPPLPRRRLAARLAGLPACLPACLPAGERRTARHMRPQRRAGPRCAAAGHGDHRPRQAVRDPQSRPSCAPDLHPWHAGCPSARHHDAHGDRPVRRRPAAVHRPSGRALSVSPGSVHPGSVSSGPPDDSRARAATPGRVPCLAPFACHAALLCGALAIASVTAAVPAVAADLEMKPVQTQWFAAAYQLTCGPLQLGVSHFADRYGARRILLVALVIFAAASLLATAATTTAVLIAARLVQGVGGAAVSPVSLALLLTLRGRTENEPHAVAGWVSTAAAAACLGPVLGGLLTSLLGWRAAFGALALLATVSAGCALHALGGPGPSPTSPRQAMDVVGIALCTGAAVTALITLTAPTVTASAPVQASTGLLTATLTGLLVLRTRRHPQGALDAGLLRQAVTRRALLVLPALFGANSAFTFLTYFTLTRAYGLSPLSAALVALPAAAPAVLTARLAVKRTGEHRDGGAAGATAVKVKPGATIRVVAQK